MLEVISHERSRIQPARPIICMPSRNLASFSTTSPRMSREAGYMNAIMKKSPKSRSTTSKKLSALYGRTGISESDG